MTPVISGSWFMKGELLFHILGHDGFISTSTQRKYTEGSVFQTKRPPLPCQENAGQVLGLWACMCMQAFACVCESARAIIVICERLNIEITQGHKTEDCLGTYNLSSRQQQAYIHNHECFFSVKVPTIP